MPATNNMRRENNESDPGIFSMSLLEQLKQPSDSRFIFFLLTLPGEKKSWIFQSNKFICNYRFQGWRDRGGVPHPAFETLAQHGKTICKIINPKRVVESAAHNKPFSKTFLSYVKFS